MRIQSVRIKNFRCLVDVKLQLRPFTVIIGPNGAGKSSLLDVISALSKLRRESLQNRMARWGGFQSALWYHAHAPDLHMELGISIGTATECLNYDFSLRAESNTYLIESERLTRDLGAMTFETPSAVFVRDSEQAFLRASGQAERRVAVENRQSLILPARAHELPYGEAFFDAIEQTSFWPAHQFRLDERASRSPQALLPTRIPLPDGSDLVAAIYSMKTERKDAYRELIETMRMAVAELEELDFPLVGHGHAMLTWKQSNYPREFYSSQLSDGTLRLLWLATALHSVPDDSLVLIDEPEISLHPQWIALLVSLMQKKSARATIVVATQNPEVIRWVEPEELLIADSTDDGATFTWASDRGDMRDWLRDFTLSELWTMGELGGRR